MAFIFEANNNFFNVVDMVIKTVNIICFLSNRCSKSLISNGELGYNLSVFVPFK